MNRMEALREMGVFIKRHQATFAALPRDSNGHISNIEIRKLLAVDIELAISLAALLAVIYLSVEHAARSEIDLLLDGRVS